MCAVLLVVPRIQLQVGEGGALYDDIVHRREHLTAHREMKKDLEQKSLGLFFLLSVMVVLLLLSFVRNHPSVMLLSVLSLSRLFSRAVLTHSLLFRRIYFKYMIEMYI